MEVNEKRETVTLKNSYYFGKVDVQSTNILKQLRLRSRGTAVSLDLPLMLHRSPFLSTLVNELQVCCSSPHDGVEILLDTISSDLLHPFKSLVETGECWVKSQHDIRDLQDLIEELGMNQVMNLSIDLKEEDPCEAIQIEDDDLQFSDYEELDDCVEIDDHDFSIPCDDSESVPAEIIQDTPDYNEGGNGVEESSYSPSTPGYVSRKRKLVCDDKRSILAAKERKCVVGLDQSNLIEGNCEIMEKQFSKIENGIPPKIDNVTNQRESLHSQQDFIEKYIEEHIRKNSVETFEVSVDDKKYDSTIDENIDQTLKCQICFNGNFSEKDLFEHLYKSHIELQRKINKSFVERVPGYYGKERNKKKFNCPLCFKSLQAVRREVGLHWAVDHKQMKPFYEEQLTSKKKKELEDFQKRKLDNEVGPEKKVIKNNEKTMDPSSELKEHQISPLQTMRRNWKKRVQTFVSTITTAEQEMSQSSQNSMDEHEKIAEKKIDVPPLSNTVSSDSQDREETKILKEVNPFKESMTDHKKVGQEKCVEKEMNNGNIDGTESDTSNEPKSLEYSTAELVKDVSWGKELSSQSPKTVNGDNMEKKENACVKEPMDVKDKISKSTEELSLSRNSSNKTVDTTGKNLSKELLQKTITKLKTNVDKKGVPTKKTQFHENRWCTKKSDVCSMDTIVDNLKDMDELGTSLLLGEAFRHRIQNSTGKLKHQLVEELWDHYTKYHSAHIESQTSQNEETRVISASENIDIRATLFQESGSDSD